MLIIDGRKTREELLPDLLKKVAILKKAPLLCIIQVGDRPDSTAFIKAKKSFAARLMIEEKHVQLPETVTQEELLKVIEKENNDNKTTGIILQLPLPAHLDKEAAIDAIAAKKDVDCLTAPNVKRWLGGKAMLPATARGIRELLAHYNISLSGKKVTVIGRSNLVGKPIAAMCLHENATVTICHSQTTNLEKETLAADIIISASGKTGLLTERHVKSGQIVVDVGINRNAEGKLCGDADFEKIKKIVQAITPVPGGVGPMTVFALFENLVDLSQ